MSQQIPRSARGWKVLVDTTSAADYPDIPRKQFDDFQAAADQAGMNNEYRRWVNIYGTIPLALLIIGMFVLRIDWGAIVWGVALAWSGFCFYRGWKAMSAVRCKAINLGRELGIFA